jgi:23S rRNA (guanosine2251-2'-O)-methyltransferase
VDRVPYRATELASAYDALGPLPVSVMLHNVRSLHNVGAFFRTADAVRIQRLYLSGITAAPPDRRIAKTALGAEQTVPWVRANSPLAVLDALREQRLEIAAIETSLHAVDLFDWRPAFPVCVLFGHEVDGLEAPLLERCDTHVRIPMLGLKHSLNVATAGGVVLFELLRKWRHAHEAP